MVRAVARTIIGLLLTAVVSLAFSPLLWPAGALPGAGTTSVFFGSPTAPATTLASATQTTNARPATSFRPRNTFPITASTSTTSTTVAPTTVATLPNAQKPPVTLPLALGRQSGHVSPVFPILGGIGIFSLIALLSTQWFLTDPGRRGPTL